MVTRIQRFQLTKIAGLLIACSLAGGSAFAAPVNKKAVSTLAGISKPSSITIDQATVGKVITVITTSDQNIVNSTGLAGGLKATVRDTTTLKLLKSTDSTISGDNSLAITGTGTAVIDYEVRGAFADDKIDITGNGHSVTWKHDSMQTSKEAQQLVKINSTTATQNVVLNLSGDTLTKKSRVAVDISDTQPGVNAYSLTANNGGNNFSLKAVNVGNTAAFTNTAIMNGNNTIEVNTAGTTTPSGNRFTLTQNVGSNGSIIKIGSFGVGVIPTSGAALAQSAGATSRRFTITQSGVANEALINLQTTTTTGLSSNHQTITQSNGNNKAYVLFDGGTNTVATINQTGGNNKLGLRISGQTNAIATSMNIKATQSGANAEFYLNQWTGFAPLTNDRFTLNQGGAGSIGRIGTINSRTSSFVLINLNGAGGTIGGKTAGSFINTIQAGGSTLTTAIGQVSLNQTTAATGAKIRTNTIDTGNIAGTTTVAINQGAADASFTGDIRSLTGTSSLTVNQTGARAAFEGDIYFRNSGNLLVQNGADASAKINIGTPTTGLALVEMSQGAFATITGFNSTTAPAVWGTNGTNGIAKTIQDGGTGTTAALKNDLRFDHEGTTRIDIHQRSFGNLVNLNYTGNTGTSWIVQGGVAATSTALDASIATIGATGNVVSFGNTQMDGIIRIVQNGSNNTVSSGQPLNTNATLVVNQNGNNNSYTGSTTAAGTHTITINQTGNGNSVSGNWTKGNTSVTVNQSGGKSVTFDVMALLGGSPNVCTQTAGGTNGLCN